MADEDEIDILGEFSFNSCLAQNSQGIPSCSSREDTVHPQWLQDSVSTNWYDFQSKDRVIDGPSRRLTGHRSRERKNTEHTSWSPQERDLLVNEMAKYGRNVRKISQTLKTKTEAEIQALIEAEFGVLLDIPSFGLEKHEDCGDIPTVVQEEIVTDDMQTVSSIAYLPSTNTSTMTTQKKPFRRKPLNTKSKNSLLKPYALTPNIIKTDKIHPVEIFYEDDLIIGSTESIGSDMDSMDIISQKMVKQHTEKIKAVKKIGNHRRKTPRNFDGGKKNRDLLKSPGTSGRQRKDSALSEETKSPKMQIVLGSGQALPVSEGEQVIKIEKKKDSEPDSDIEVDIDSDNDKRVAEGAEKVEKIRVEEPIVVQMCKFEPMPRRQKKINLDGGGGYTIMHTAAGDLYAVGAEPRKERAPKKQPVHLVHCRLYNADRPAPYEVRLYVSCLIAMDAHAHTSLAEVMGLVGGARAAGRLELRAYRAASAAASGTHCDMDPVSQAAAAESLRSLQLLVCAWHHSHPSFPAAPSPLDLRTQRALQQALERHTPLLGLITSQHWPTGRTASQYRCIRVEDTDDSVDEPIGYQFSVKLVPDLTRDSLPPFLDELRVLLRDTERNKYSVDMVKDACPQAGITYLEKCTRSVSHHMQSAGYGENESVTAQLIQGIRDVFR